MRKRSFLAVFLGVAALFTISSVGTGYADPKGGGGLAKFTCQIDIVFPTNTIFKVPAGDNCEGGAIGQAMSLSGKKGPTVWESHSLWTPLTKTQTRNFFIYNILYAQDCGILTGLPVPPPVGVANGHALIHGTGFNQTALPPTGKPGSVHTGFFYTRVGITWIAILIDPHMHNGHLAKGHKASKPGGFGVAQGVFGVKPVQLGGAGPVGNCAFGGATMMTVVIAGEVEFVNNF